MNRERSRKRDDNINSERGVIYMNRERGVITRIGKERERGMIT